MEIFRELIYFIKEKRGIIVISILAIVGFFISCFGVYRLCVNNAKEDKEKDFSILEERDVQLESSIIDDKDETVEYSVEIKGEVVKPGVYTLNSDKRVIDVVNMAKGFTKSADSSVINLSKKLKDEMVIIVYSKKEVAQFVKTKEQEEEKLKICKQEYEVENNACLEHKDINSNESTTSVNNENISNANSGTNNNGTDSFDSTINKVSINSATLEELMSLSGIGEAKAQAIIDYRLKVSKFNKIEDIMNVSGIGEALFEKIKDNITV